MNLNDFSIWESLTLLPNFRKWENRMGGSITPEQK